MDTYKMFINGEYVDAISGKTYQTENPATEEIIAEVAQGDAEDVEVACGTEPHQLVGSVLVRPARVVRDQARHQVDGRAELQSLSPECRRERTDDEEGRSCRPSLDDASLLLPAASPIGHQRLVCPRRCGQGSPACDEVEPSTAILRGS